MNWQNASEDERAVENVRRWLHNLPSLEEEEDAARRAAADAMDRSARAAADAIRRDAGFVPLTHDVVRFDSDDALLRRLSKAGRHARCLECDAPLYSPHHGSMLHSFWCRECHQRFEQQRTAADDVLKDFYGRVRESVAAKD